MRILLFVGLLRVLSLNIVVFLHLLLPHLVFRQHSHISRGIM